MKAIMLGWEYPPKIDGGLGTHFYNLAGSLAKEGTEITAVLPDFCAARDKKNLKFLYAKAGKQTEGYLQSLSRIRRYNQSAFRTASKAIREKKIDVIHAHDWITFEAALHLRKTTGTKLVATFHSTEYDRNEYADGKSRMARLEAQAAKKADAIIAVSRMVKETLVEKYGVDPKKISVIPNGRSIKKFPKAKTKRTILFTGRLAGQKGAEHLISAIPRVSQNYRFIFCGAGHLRKPLEDYARMLGVSNRVEFTGFLQKEQLSYKYVECSLFVSTSLREPFGISLLDAMSAGKPCIATTRTGLLESIPKGACLTIPEKNPAKLAEAISSLLDNPKKMVALGKKAKQAAKAFSWQKTARLTKRAYLKTMQQSLPNK